MYCVLMLSVAPMFLLLQKGHLQPLDNLVRGRSPTFQLQHGHHAHWEQEVRFMFTKQPSHGCHGY